ncbi:MAG TPA: hypothetical protein VGL96_12185, partial [Casimicrobiaceae bacterium]
MPDNNHHAAVVDRPLPRERVQDALAEVTALLRRHRLVEGLIHEQAAHAPESGAPSLEQSSVARATREAL